MPLPVQPLTLHEPAVSLCLDLRNGDRSRIKSPYSSSPRTFCNGNNFFSTLRPFKHSNAYIPRPSLHCQSLPGHRPRRRPRSRALPVQNRSGRGPPTRLGSPRLPRSSFPYGEWYILGISRGISKRWATGCVKIRWKSCVLLPAIRKQSETFSPYFTQPGAQLLEIPCLSAKKFA